MREQQTRGYRPTRAARKIDALRDALGKVQANLLQCQYHRTLCVHERDALKIANEALLAYAALDSGAMSE